MHLTKSFRLGKECSKLANNLLHKLDRKEELLGVRSPKKLVTTEEIETVHARLFMSNASLTHTALQLYQEGVEFFINDPNRNILETIKDYFRLTEGKWGRSETFQGFNSWDEVLKLQREESDTPFGTFVRLLENNDPTLLRKAALASQGKPSSKYITLSTVHQAKGKEWPNVVIDQDLVLRGMKEDPTNAAVTDEHLRLLYVAITRAKNVLQMPPNLYSYCIKQPPRPSSSKHQEVPDTEHKRQCNVPTIRIVTSPEPRPTAKSEPRRYAIIDIETHGS